VAVKFLDLKMWNDRSDGKPERTGPVEPPMDHSPPAAKGPLGCQGGPPDQLNHRFFFRYSQNRHRGSLGSGLARGAGRRRLDQIPSIKSMGSSTTAIFLSCDVQRVSPGYMRRENPTPVRFGDGENWAENWVSGGSGDFPVSISASRARLTTAMK